MSSADVNQSKNFFLDFHNILETQMLKFSMDICSTVVQPSNMSEKQVLITFPAEGWAASYSTDEIWQAFNTPVHSVVFPIEHNQLRLSVTIINITK